MRFLVFLLMIFSFCFACTPKNKRIPKDILPVDSMKIIVWHLMEAGEFASYKKERDSSVKQINMAYFGEVLKLHHLDKNSFVKSFNFYQANPYFNNILFDSINNYASRQRAENYKKRQ